MLFIFLFFFLLKRYSTDHLTSQLEWTKKKTTNSILHVPSVEGGYHFWNDFFLFTFRTTLFRLHVFYHHQWEFSIIAHFHFNLIGVLQTKMFAAVTHLTNDAMNLVFIYRWCVKQFNLSYLQLFCFAHSFDSLICSNWIQCEIQSIAWCITILINHIIAWIMTINNSFKLALSVAQLIQRHWNVRWLIQ